MMLNREKTDVCARIVSTKLETKRFSHLLFHNVFSANLFSSFGTCCSFSSSVQCNIAPNPNMDYVKVKLSRSE